jgi:hypothetical protein
MLQAMCRNIRTLHNFDPAATHEEVHAAALQYVRKISGTTKPSKANQEAFQRAVEEVTAVSERLLASLVTQAPPRDRDVEAAKARARAAKRYAAA